MWAPKPRKQSESAKKQLIQSTHIIYTPKIIKFIYARTEKTLNQHQYLSKQIRTENSNSKNINLQTSNYSVVSKKSMMSQRKGKIQLVSSRKPIIYLKGKKKTKKANTEHSFQQSNVGQNKTLALNFPIRKNHITSTSVIPNFSCDFFSECNEDSYVDVGQRKPLPFNDSRKTITKNHLSKVQAKTIIHSEKKESGDCEIDGKSLYDFRKRKNIFAEQNLSRTFDFGSIREKSRSRKSIFEQRTKLCDLSFSKDSKNRSTSKRKRIFQGYTLQKSTVTVKSSQQQLPQCQIPRQIFEGWQQFSPESQKEETMSKGVLQTVEELRIQQSQVRLIG